MKLGWTVIFSHTQVPLIYYGDELGMPGYTDPDNRQPLWWYTGAGIPGSMAEMDARLSGESREVLRHVAALGELRRNHPALHKGTTTEWWLDDDVYGFSRVDAESGDKVLVLVNRGAERTLSNGLGFAGLPSDGVFEDALSGERFVASGDNLSVNMGAVSSRILRPI
jgi:alpha-amylase